MLGMRRSHVVLRSLSSSVRGTRSRVLKTGFAFVQVDVREGSMVAHHCRSTAHLVYVDEAAVSVVSTPMLFRLLDRLEKLELVPQDGPETLKARFVDQRKGWSVSRSTRIKYTSVANPLEQRPQQ